MFIFVTAAMADKKEGNPKKVQRFGMVTGLKSEKLGHYKQLHAAAWPGVLKKIKECNSQNYSIYLQKIAEQIANYVGQNDLTSFLMRLGKSTHKSKLEPYLSMVLSRTGLITADELNLRLNGG